MSGPYQGHVLSTCGAEKIRIAINCDVLNVKLQLRV